MTTRVATITRAAGSFVDEWSWSTPVVATLVATFFSVGYLILGPSDQQDIHDDLARAFMQGQLWVPWGSHWELVTIDGERAWSPFPPVPALTYIPLLAIGITPTVTVLASAFGGVGVALIFLIARRMDVPLRTALWLVDATGPLLILLCLAYRNRGPDWLLRLTALFGVAATLYAWAAELWWNFRSVSPAVLP